MLQLATIEDRSTLPPDDRKGERGAALLTVLLISILLFAAGGALIMTTSFSATNAVDASAETQAYHAAEAGMQATLAVLRGNVAPNPLFDTSSSTAAANHITFRKAVTLSSSNATGDTSVTARLSRWLSYNVTTPRGPAVGLSSPYSPLTGMAFDIALEDPDNTANETYSTLGAFGSDSPSSSNISYQFGSGGNKVTVTYTPQASSLVSASGTTLGTFSINTLQGTPAFSTDPKSTFTITIRQVNSNGTVNVPVKCTIAQVNGNTISITFQMPSPTSNAVAGTMYTHASSITVSSGGSTSIPVTIAIPEPSRLKVTVNGYGPRGAKKQMHMLVNRYAFDWAANSTITLRSADDNSVLTFNAGNSAQYLYSGFDNAGGSPTSAFGVTSSADYNYLLSLSLNGNQVSGSPSAVQQISISSLPTWLQTANGARDLVNGERIRATIENRYFTSAPASFGTPSEPLFTFVDGDVDLPPAGGAGLLIVTGTLTLNGSSQFDGVILVLGSGQLIRSGGGNGTSLGTVYVASFGSSGNFLAPTFNSNGSGNSTISYDSEWARRAAAAPGPQVMAVSEF
ncbi:MAG TPA: hypothetical protein VNG71_12365 [Pyrinomonadaceae bacterium]|nr:hypothetical protein [Pyrinomonadaceae bacterium]